MNTPLKKPLALADSTSAARLVQLRAQVAQALPDTDFAPGTDPMGHSTLTIRLANRVELLASGDMDLPWLLFEVVRYVPPGDVTKHPFEGCTSPSYAFTDKLSGQAAVDLIGQYARLPAPAPAPTQS